jgi:GTP-binding protein EngB required for normal cell division
VKQIAENMKIIEKLIEKVNNPEFKVLYDFLNERVEYPESFVTLLGETSSGKSSLINGLLDGNILYTAPQPTTGSIVEIMDDSFLSEPEFYAITKDAKIAELTAEQFKQYSKDLPDSYERVRMLIPSFPTGLEGLRLFDTPGYGSIYEKHEEILKSFLPNSDILIYVVNYRVGVNQSDAEFISVIEELLRDDMKFYLVINRAPQDATVVDRRVKEIINHVQDLLHRDIPVHIVPGVIPTNDGEPALPKAEELWENVKREIVSPQRQDALYRSLLGFQKSLLLDIQGYLEKKKLEYVVSDEERKLIKEALDEFSAKKPMIEEKIIATFSKVTSTSKKMFVNSTNVMKDKIETEITASNRWTNQQECAGFVEAHLMPVLAKKETNNVKAYIEREFARLNEEIESMLNTAVQRFENKLQVDNKAFEKLVINVGNRIAQRFADQALREFFRQYGGAGGAGAGVANAAKKGLKKLGELVGKTFSRETHNQLASFLSKIGATSTRAIGAAAVVIVEAAFYLYEVKVWQSKLIKHVGKAVAIWEDKSIQALESDLGELKTHNLEQIASFFKEYENSFSLDEYQEHDGALDEIEEQLKDTQELLNQFQHEEVAS